ncbi:Uncharacterised protein [Mycoplasmopsis synoviae]|uniref:Uncharacterized protein n=1 Tax=Mycoplasmopsis synoviae TaxID=2109 RepID=A0A3B0PWR1_MYCSY|nr:Uncharacterised protein [Mycoplasmopsis synoviae]
MLGVGLKRSKLLGDKLVYFLDTCLSTAAVAFVIHDLKVASAFVKSTSTAKTPKSW